MSEGKEANVRVASFKDFGIWVSVIGKIQAILDSCFPLLTKNGTGFFPPEWSGVYCNGDTRKEVRAGES